MDHHEADWLRIPGHVLSKVGEKCKTRVDVLRFRSICPSFFTSVPRPPNPISPHQELDIIFPMNGARGRRGHFALAESTIYAIEPIHALPISHHHITKTWLVKVEELKNGTVRLEDPLSRIPLDNMVVGQRLPQGLNFLDYNFKEITKSYRLELVGMSVGRNRYRGLGGRHVVLFEKVAVSRDEGIVLMALISGGQIGVWRSTSTRWALMNTGAERFYFKDVTYCNKKFYALERQGMTIKVDPITLHVSYVAGPLILSRGMKCLVKTSTDLFLVDKYWVNKKKQKRRRNQDQNQKQKRKRPRHENTMDVDDNEVLRLDVYKLDQERKKWIQVTGDQLEDNILFVGEDSSFSLSANDFAAFERNCVYFSDDDLFDAECLHPGTSTGVFDMRSDAAKRLSNVPGYSNLFWPPPAWVRQNPAASSSLNVGWFEDEDSFGQSCGGSYV